MNDDEDIWKDIDDILKIPYNNINDNGYFVKIKEFFKEKTMSLNKKLKNNKK